MDPDDIGEPLLLAQSHRLDRDEGTPAVNARGEALPQTIFVVSAMPGNLSASGATLEMAELNFKQLLQSLLRRLEQRGISPQDWWRTQRAAMTDDELRAWRREASRTFLPRGPVLRTVGPIAYIQTKKLRNARLSVAA